MGFRLFFIFIASLYLIYKGFDFRKKNKDDIKVLPLFEIENRDGYQKYLSNQLIFDGLCFLLFVFEILVHYNFIISATIFLIGNIYFVIRLFKLVKFKR
ncbi:hypothetical protein [Caloranaerobacter sp. DY30410]|uniref:hypothetical protein n=1 Tax=Caloranaerobacter sp. DY30410 TaxID=3238305 RepID=UPI003CFE29E7